MTLTKTDTMAFEKSLTTFLTLLLCAYLCSAEFDVCLNSSSTLEDALQYLINTIEADDGPSRTHDDDDEMKSSCKLYLNEYAIQSSAFTMCLIQNARPFRFCETCVVPYEKALRVFNLITSDRACSKELLMSDRVQVMRLVNKNMENIWEKANCADCFESVEVVNGTVYSNRTASTLHLLELFCNLTSCLNSTLQYVESSETKTGNSSYCDKCRKDYEGLNQYFTSVVGERSSEVCMDVVDMMNYTRLMWSKKLGCSHRYGNIVPVVAITGVVCALPVIFYIANRLIRARTERTIVIQRRMKFPQSNYGSLTGSLLSSNSQTIGSFENSQTPR